MTKVFASFIVGLMIGLLGCLPASGSRQHFVVLENQLVVDVRTPEEFAAGHLEGAINVPHDQVDEQLYAFGSDKDRPILVYCRTGRRASVARDRLIANGFTNVTNGGAYDDLKQG